MIKNRDPKERILESHYFADTVMKNLIMWKRLES